jgi:hypothetical protein
VRLADVSVTAVLGGFVQGSVVIAVGVLWVGLFAGALATLVDVLRRVGSRERRSSASRHGVPLRLTGFSAGIWREDAVDQPETPNVTAR